MLRQEQPSRIGRPPGQTTWPLGTLEAVVFNQEIVHGMLRVQTGPLRLIVVVLAVSVIIAVVVIIVVAVVMMTGQ